MNYLKRFALTVTFITSIPLSRLPANFNQHQMAGLAKYLPSVGLMLGLILASISWILNYLHTGALMSSSVLTITWLALTGGIHFDGLMDVADGIFSHSDPKRMLEIMKDSRTGNFGAITGFCVIAMKIAALATISGPCLIASLIVVPAWARFCETYAIGAFPYLRDEGAGKIWHDTMRFPADLGYAAVVPLITTAFFTRFSLVLPFEITIVTIVSGFISSHWIASVVGGQTGDTYGATVELSEVGALFLTALLVAH